MKLRSLESLNNETVILITGGRTNPYILCGKKKNIDSESNDGMNVDDY